MPSLIACTHPISMSDADGDTDMTVDEVRQGDWPFAGEFVDFGNGYVGIPSMHITKDPRVPPPQLVGACMAMDHTWLPKGVPGLGDGVMVPQAQRCPAVTVDNFTLCYKTDGSMAEPVLVLGEFKKWHIMAGTKHLFSGLVLAAGGHYERMGPRPEYYRDKGNYNLFDAAKTELMEEIGIDDSGIVASCYLGCIDDCENDPRHHAIRHLVMRWIDKDPQESEELERLWCIPLSQIKRFLDGSCVMRVGRNPMPIALNHNRVIDLILAMPKAQAFVRSITATGRSAG